MHRQRAVLESSLEEGRDSASIVGSHSVPVGVEDPDDPRFQTMLSVAGEGECLGESVRLVVDPTGTDRVDVSLIGLRLGIHEGVAYTSEVEARKKTAPFSYASPLVGPERTDFSGCE